MELKNRTYNGEKIDVSFDVKRCIHARECVNGLPQVFDVDKRPWISPDNAAADDLAEVVERCPTGALHYDRKDGGAEESADMTNTVRVAANGPLFVRGRASIVNAAGEVLLNDTRIALCRCGASKNKPLCDNSHLDAKFSDDGMAAAPDGVADPAPGVELGISPATDGPLLLNGDFSILDAERNVIFTGQKAALCRCGASSNKPFCDGTHTNIGFKSE